MKLLTSSKLTLPTIYFISDREEIKELPVGVPFIYGDAKREEGLVRILEYETLYQEALKSKYPFDFKKILKDNGFHNLEEWVHGGSTFMDYTTEEMGGEDFDVDEAFELMDSLKVSSDSLSKYLRDSSAYVDMQKLKELNVFPLWLDTIEEAVNTNIHNFATYNPNMYSKKLDGMYGGLEMTPAGKNLIIIDISSSIPRAVSSTCLTLAKNLAESFYADIIITGSKSTLYSYENLEDLDVERAYNCGMGNESRQIRALLASDSRHYKTVICFGDDDAIGGNWGGYGSISDEDGKELCTWTVDKLINFHTENHKGGRYWKGQVAGYSRWFSPKETEHIADWVKYLK